MATIETAPPGTCATSHNLYSILFFRDFPLLASLCAETLAEFAAAEWLYPSERRLEHSRLGKPSGTNRNRVHPSGFDEAQQKRFIEAARKAGASEDEAVFGENLKRVATAHPKADLKGGK